MRQVLVHRPRLSFRAADWDALFRGVVEQVVAAPEALVKDRFTPRS